VIGSGPGDHEPRPIRVADKAEGVARDAETALHFGADGNILNVFPQGAGEKTVQGVPAIPADILAEQSAADSETDLFHARYASTFRFEGKPDHEP
jgi:hypothetical protein